MKPIRGILPDGIVSAYGFWWHGVGDCHVWRDRDGAWHAGRKLGEALVSGVKRQEVVDALTARDSR